MPYLPEELSYAHRPLKRRRLDTWSNMARNSDETDLGSSAPSDTELQRPTTADSNHTSSSDEVRTSDREELIQCIKRGQRTTWVPKPNLQALCAEADEQAHAPRPRYQEARDHYVDRPKPSVEANDVPLSSPRPATPNESLNRPPSALHTGDFYQTPPQKVPLQVSTSSKDANSQVASPQSATPVPWAWTPPRFQRTLSDIADAPTSPWDVGRRARAPSLGSSLSSSFVMRPPTSPLVNAITNPALEPSEGDLTLFHDQADDRAARRRTLPSHAFAQLRMSPIDGNAGVAVPVLRREASAPFQMHKSRRSLNAFTYQPASSSQSIFPSRQRRLSYASDTSPLQRTSMVGSFEESILRGRMSTAPSKPLDFLAEIGVMGKGNCPAKLKCPAHVKIPFPAVFYNYPSSTGFRSISDDSPSPYVGSINLKQHLNAVEQPTERQRQRDTNDPDELIAQLTGPENTSIGKALAAREHRQPGSDKLEAKYSLGGAYRVPQQGQVQVIIKNPNNTAVKLFLIPYDLEGMKPGTKTFVRQRSYSSGPVVENVVSNKPIQDPLSEKQILRYLIHLKFCCPAKGRFYLYDSMRVVFANRVPDGKEKLRNETQVPEPKYGTFVPDSTDSRRQSVSGSPTPSSTPSNSAPRVSSMLYDLADGIPSRSDLSSAPIPFHLSKITSRELPDMESAERKYGSSNQQHITTGSMHTTTPQSPEIHGFERTITSPRGSPVPWGSRDVLGTRSPSPAPLANGSGLLSRRLREFERTSNSEAELEGTNGSTGQGNGL